MRRYIGIRGLDIRLITPLMLMMGMILLVSSASDWLMVMIMIRHAHAHIWRSFGVYIGGYSSFSLLGLSIQNNICNSPLATCNFIYAERYPVVQYCTAPCNAEYASIVHIMQ